MEPVNTGSGLLPKLPKLTIPKFDGDYLKWRQLYDLFAQLVHNQPLSNCQKMWYLKTNLTGEAERLLRHFTLAEDNYMSAWQMLQERYNNKRLLVTALVNKLLSQPGHSHDNPSASNLKMLHDTTQECLLSLQNLDVPTDQWDPILLHLLVKKLDKASHMLYEQSLPNPKELPTVKGFLAFLENRFHSLEALGPKSESIKRQNLKGLTSALSTATNYSRCPSCKTNHPLYSCSSFLKLTPSSRLDFLRRNNLCVNCLRSGHSASKCTLRGCVKCNKKHNSLVHLNASDKSAHKSSEGTYKSAPVSTNTSSDPNNQAVSLTALKNNKERSYILLSTVMITLVSPEGSSLECRAILDSGSQVNLVIDKVVRSLGLSTKPDSMCIQGIGRQMRASRQRINVRMQSNLNGFATQLEAFVLPQIISPQPTQYLDISTWPIPKNIKLADPRFNHPDRIDVLLGAEFYHQLMSIGQIRLADDLPVLQNTVFGWILAGRIDRIPLRYATCGICSEDEEETSQLIEKFWKLEEVESHEPRLTAAEKRCEIHFTQTHQRDKSGRFIVSLPFAEDPSILGESRQIAFNRFLAIERKLNKNISLKRQYVEFMKEYHNLGHMVEIDLNNIPSPHYFLPHHCVQKPGSSTTKLRVVFDASAKTSSGYSLNDVLHTGPTIQDELFSILLRFRRPRFVLTTDIEKMYRQVLIQPDDQKYQLIFWRNDPEETLKCYQLRTVTYGTRPAPYLATKCLQKLAQDNKSRYPYGAQVLQHDFYVDDGMSGSDDLPTTIKMQEELTAILQGAGFKLRKWCANHPRLLQGIPIEDQEVELDFDNENERGVKTLGLTWLPKTDQFRVKTTWDQGTHVTKRIVISDLARLFDPLGIVAPVIVTAKIFCQQLWQLKLNWDEALPEELHTKWIMFRNSLKALDNIRFTRHIFSHEAIKAVQIHAFADASEKAYGAAIYVRSVTRDNRILVRLLCAKSRVAPLKKQTIPRLELCAAVLAAQLTVRIKRDLNLENTPTYFWTDSEIVLAWIGSQVSSFHTFVANRVATIQELSLTQQWRHVSSKENPADVLSRGLAPEKLASCNLWFYGPLFLHGREELWPTSGSLNIQVDDTQERKRGTPTSTAAVATNAPEEIIYQINHGNSFRRLQRIIAYMQRFTNHTRHPNNQRPENNALKAQELDAALITIIKAMQASDFKREIEQLKNHHEVDKTSAISSLSPFLDNKGIIRVGGRLTSSELPYDAKHQMVIPYADPLTKLLIADLHKENLHCGPQTLLAHVRQRFWPIKGKTIVRSVVQHCIPCTKARPKLFSQMMGNLPSTRVQPARPFINSGVDFFGPVLIHFKTRGKRPQKAYVAVFCCFATKAIHMEVASDLSTNAFLGCLKRFIGRRGHCRNLYCDNATNFVGAKNQLTELTTSIYSEQARNSITDTCSKRGIDFHYIPPRAPHFGGLWEAAVKSAKHHLLRSTSSASLTYEELETVIIEIEAILNSRPLTPMSTDPNDLTALTPGHFLIGEPLTAQVDASAQPTKTSLLTRWKLITHLKNEFWNRWSREYLNELQYRHKWKEQCQSVKPDAMVIIKDDNLPVMQWPLGRVVQTYQGEDGLVRVVDVRTSKGVFRRPIHRLAPLPMEESNSPEGDSSKLEGHTEQTSTRASTDEEDGTPRKRIKVSHGSLITTILLACLVLRSVRGNPITVTQFDSSPGIHFENIGNVNLIAADWKLLVYYDLKPYWTEFAVLSNGTATLHHLCQQIHQKSTCNQIVNQFRHTTEELRIDNSLLPAIRVKRGALNIVGNVANSLFGVLDSDYAEQMSNTIRSINENEDHLVSLLKNQTSIIDSTINIIKRDQAAAEQRFNSLEGQITQMINRIHDTGEETYQLKIFQLLTSLAIQMTIMASDLQRIQSSVIDALTDTHHGKISPLLLSPQQLKRELSIIRSHLPSSTHLPIDQEDILELYKLMSVEGRIMNDHAIFRITLPLITQGQFDLFRVIPIPVLVNTSLVAIDPSTSLVAINYHRDQYYPMTEHTLASCLTLKGTTYLCPNSQPIYQRGARICACEINLLNNMTQQDCKLRKVENSPVWIQLNHNNQWIYAMKQPTKMNAVCGSQTFQLALKGSGLLRLQSECVIKHDLITIQGHHIFPSNIKTSYTAFGELSEITKPELLPPILTETSHYHSQLKELTAIQNLLASSQEGLELPHKVQNLPHFTAGYLGLLLSIIVTCYLIWRVRTQLFKCNKNPDPQPNQSRTADYTVHV